MCHLLLLQIYGWGFKVRRGYVRFFVAKIPYNIKKEKRRFKVKIIP